MDMRKVPTTGWHIVWGYKDVAPTLAYRDARTVRVGETLSHPKYDPVLVGAQGLHYCATLTQALRIAYAGDIRKLTSYICRVKVSERGVPSDAFARDGIYAARHRTVTEMRVGLPLFKYMGEHLDELLGFEVDQYDNMETMEMYYYKYARFYADKLRNVAAPNSSNIPEHLGTSFVSYCKDTAVVHFNENTDSYLAWCKQFEKRLVAAYKELPHAQFK